MVKVLKLPPTSTEGKEHFSEYGTTGETGFVDRTKEGKIRYAPKGTASEKDCPAVTLTSLFVKVRVCVCVDECTSHALQIFA